MIASDMKVYICYVQKLIYLHVIDVIVVAKRPSVFA